MIGAKVKNTQENSHILYSVNQIVMETWIAQICQSLRGNKTDVTILINMPRQQSIKVGFRLQLEISEIL